MKYQYYYVEIINLYFHELLCCERCYIRPEIIIMIPCSKRTEFTFGINTKIQMLSPTVGESTGNVGESIWLRQIMNYQYYYVEIINLYFHEQLFNSSRVSTMNHKQGSGF